MLSAFLITGWTTCFVAIIVAYHDNYDKYWALYMTFNKRSKTRELSDSVSRSTQRPKNTTPYICLGARKMLGSLRDLQAITGACILIAGLGQLPGLVYYHESLICSIWNLTVNSLWAAETNAEGNIRGTAREVVALISVLLAIVFHSLSNIRQWHNWDSEVSGLCYRSHEHSAEWLDWFWVTGLVIFAIHEFINFSSRSCRKLDKFLTAIDKAVVKIDSRYTERVGLITNLLHDISQSGNTLSWLKALSKLITILSTNLRRLVQFLWFLSGQLMAGWATGHGKYGIETIIYIGLAIWNTFDIIDLKASNKRCSSRAATGAIRKQSGNSDRFCHWRCWGC